MAESPLRLIKRRAVLVAISLLVELPAAAATIVLLEGDASVSAQDYRPGPDAGPPWVTHEESADPSADFDIGVAVATWASLVSDVEPDQISVVGRAQSGDGPYSGFSYSLVYRLDEPALLSLAGGITGGWVTLESTTPIGEPVAAILEYYADLGSFEEQPFDDERLLLSGTYRLFAIGSGEYGGDLDLTVRVVPEPASGFLVAVMETGLLRFFRV